MTEQQLTCELNGIKYLLVELCLTADVKDKYMTYLKKFDAIYQGIKEIKATGWWSSGYAIVKVLVPENRIIEFNSTDVNAL